MTVNSIKSIIRSSWQDVSVFWKDNMSQRFHTSVVNELDSILNHLDNVSQKLKNQTDDVSNMLNRFENL